MQRVLGALLEGDPVPDGARAALSDAERAEIDALRVAAVLTRTALHRGEPAPQAEAASLRRAQGALTTHSRPKAPAPAVRRTGIVARIARWLGRR